MKRVPLLVIIGLLVLGLTACAPKENKVIDPIATATALAEGDAFSEELAEMDKDIFCPLYGLDEESLTSGVVYGSTGTTAEEMAILVFKDADAATAGLAVAKNRIDQLVEENRDYRPGEAPKLKTAIVEQHGTAVILVVANDTAAARRVIDKIK